MIMIIKPQQLLKANRNEYLAIITFYKIIQMLPLSFKLQFTNPLLFPYIRCLGFSCFVNRLWSRMSALALRVFPIFLRSISICEMI